MKLEKNQVLLTFFYESEALEFFSAVQNDARVILIYDHGQGIIEDFNVIRANHLVEDE